MSNSTPPGWYPAPGTGTGGAAAQERWWDGSAWTSEVRPAAPVDAPPAAAQIADAPTQAWQAAPPAPPAAPQPGYGYPPAPGQGYPPSGYPGVQGPPGYPPAPGYPVGPQAPQRKSNAVVISVVAAVLVAGGIAAGVALTSGDGPSPRPLPTIAVPTITMPTLDVPTVPSFDPSPTASPTRRSSPTPSPRVSPPASVTGTVPDEQHGITVPVLSGWTQTTPGSTATVFLSSGSYTCPGGGTCVRGQFAVKADSIQGASARAAAEAAMPLYAQAIFDGLTSHTDARSSTVVVAGVSGYAVRWHVRTKDGLSGYVLLAAVPAESGGFVVFNGGVDEDPLAPGPAALEQILLGIEQDTAAGSGA
ncbi:DUF2510 domain-containing protein [Kitasatospora sp. NPDC057223]|uniref:DUF2510 domain-containing protein n=1 Tax=Kitasatospora sp. NPDC057223 TaxID=3346055 RepID=UPI00363099D3